ncbi:hypothetical protein [Flavobacterium caeni]|uniref:Uncharacterized protein n=1 Tax=Flavobacterium caeni TaxID=490189 RepID=A0A1G5FNB9_9FLAO|nr:hypothetical protein [Flavobacterium caeni]SCY40775.1 hypothetical protein SAMN02927903_01350 [Flavobacterium caeni]
MKRFLIKFVLFLLPIGLLAYGLDVFISSNLRKSTGFTKGEMTVWSDLYDKKVNSEILVMGSSRAWVHLDAKMIGDSLHTSAYNLGMDGHNFWMQDFRFQLAMQQPVKPKVVIQSIDVFTLARRKDLFYSEQFLPYMLGNDSLQKVTQNFIGYENYDFHIPLIRYYGKGKAMLEAFKIALGGKNEPTRIRGYQGQLIPWTNELEEAKKRMNHFTVEMEPQTVALFERYIQFCKASGIQLVFVYSPEYIEGQQFIANRKQMIDVYRKFAQKYSIPFFDYSTDPISYDRNYFYNALHMNKFGAEKFTAEFIQDLRTLDLKY